MIGWENDRGAYYINKLQEQIDSTNENVSDIDDSVDELGTSLGSISEQVNSLLPTAPYLIGALSTSKGLEIDVETTTKALLMTSGSTEGSCNVFVVHSTGADAVICKPMSTSANVSITITTGHISIASNSGTIYVSAIVFFGSLTKTD